MPKENTDRSDAFRIFLQKRGRVNGDYAHWGSKARGLALL
ncbi:hypothetical protein CSB66_3063 [Enterobacter hormaechei]|nr:hypothetical protein CSB66_3063 [Enterobacter hormaechei]